MPPGGWIIFDQGVVYGEGAADVISDRITLALAAGVAEYPWTTWDIAHLLD